MTIPDAASTSGTRVIKCLEVPLDVPILDADRARREL